jgi:hypothetical protein
MISHFSRRDLPVKTPNYEIKPSIPAVVSLGNIADVILKRQVDHSGCYLALSDFFPSFHAHAKTCTGIYFFSTNLSYSLFNHLVENDSGTYCSVFHIYLFLL